jgi:hypothetical protein
LYETVGMGISAGAHKHKQTRTHTQSNKYLVASYRIRLKGELAGKGMLEFAHQIYSHEQLKV